MVRTEIEGKNNVGFKPGATVMVMVSSTASVGGKSANLRFVLNVPELYLRGRAAVSFDRIHYGVGGIQLLDPDQLSGGQIGYAVLEDGTALSGDADGDWHTDWLVIGNETAFGDPIFISVVPPYPVYTAMHGEGSWDAKLVAPSVDDFWKCLKVFGEFAEGRSNPVELQAHPPSDDEITAYREHIDRLCGGNPEAIEFWVVQAEIGL